MARPPTAIFTVAFTGVSFLPPRVLWGGPRERRSEASEGWHLARLAFLVILAPCKNTKSDRQLSSLGQPDVMDPSHHPGKLPPRKPAVPAVGWLRLCKVMRTFRDRCHHPGLGRGSKKGQCQCEVTQDLRWPEMRSHVAWPGWGHF